MSRQFLSTNASASDPGARNPTGALQALIAAATVCRIDGLALPEGELAGRDILRRGTANLLASLYCEARPWMYAIEGSVDALNVTVGWPRRLHDTGSTVAAARAALATATISERPGDAGIGAFSRCLSSWSGVAFSGRPRGDATEPTALRTGASSVNSPACAGPHDALIRLLHGRPFLYLHVATPMDRDWIIDETTALRQAIEEYHGAYFRRGTAEEHHNPSADRQLQMLEAELAVWIAAEHRGMWTCWTALYAPSASDVSSGVALLQGEYGGSPRALQPWRPVRIDQGTGLFNTAPTALNCLEVADLCAVPGEEHANYPVRRGVRFAEAAPILASATPRLSIGSPAGGRRPLEVAIADMAKHGLIVGMSGNGKTTTCQHILDQLWREHRIPWLVIEPSRKCEYRRLLRGAYPHDLRVFTPGGEAVAPIRMDIFRVQEGIHVQQHIDSLHELFLASFALETPMPEILQQALHHVYVELGWNLLTGVAGDRVPTFHDLQRALDTLIARMGYDREISGNLRAALRNRLVGLTTGGKGLLFGGGGGPTIGDILERPTVIELSAITNNDDKAFVMSALLLQIANHRQAQGASDGALRHVTLIEEAHRVLGTADRQRSVHQADPKAAATASFAQALAEVRAYGEGLLIVDQSPAGLCPDILRGTSLKIAHRLTAAEDRQAMAHAMILETTQSRELAVLQPGECLVHLPGMHNAMQLSIPFRELPGTPPSDAEIATHMAGHRAPPPPPARPPTIAPPAPTTTTRLACAGCEFARCPLRAELREWLQDPAAVTRVETGFRGGWDGIHALGLELAREFRPCGKAAHVARCLILHLASIRNVSPDIMARLERNLPRLFTPDTEPRP